MTSASDDTITDLYAALAALRVERDAALSEKAALTEELAARTAELAQRDSEYREHIGHQAATVEGMETLKVENEELRAAQAAGLEVLQAMIASPGDTQPVFDLIARQAANLCEVPIAAAAVFDGVMVRLVSQSGFDAAYAEVFAKQFPRPPSPDFAMGRAIVNRRVEQIEDTSADTRRDFAPPPGPGSALAVPLLRNGAPLGVIAVGRRVAGPYSKNQITLLQTFAEQAVIAIGSAEMFRDLEARTASLAQRNSEYGERIEHQSATIDVLKAMSASPDNTQPVFDLIVRRVAELCNVPIAGLFEYDGELLFHRSGYGLEHARTASGSLEAYLQRFPMPPTRRSIVSRAILDRQIIHIRDFATEPDLYSIARDIGLGSQLSVPLLREETAIGVISMSSREPGGFSDSQVALLQTFAEQAVIAITSAETYRALQTRTSDLQEALEYQTATSDVLKVISRSTFDLQPVLDAVVEAAARLCDADQAMIWRREGELMRLVANHGFPPEYEAFLREREAYPIDRAPRNVGPRAIREGRVVHVHDAAAEPGYTEAAIRLGRQRTSLGVPLLREGETVGSIVLARQRVEPFTDRQMELVSTFADQAVIAIENTRLITEQREALEQRTATAEVLQVINASPGNLAPVFDAMLEKAMRLCGATIGGIYSYNGEGFEAVALLGVTPAFREYNDKYPMRSGVRPGSLPARMIETRGPVQTSDVMVSETYRAGSLHARALAEIGGIRAILDVPLLKEETLLGFIAIYREEPGTFSDKQIALLENFAAQAVIAMENARLINEQREALEQQTATADVLQVINASPGDLKPVFDAILEKAHSLCGVALGELELYEDGKFRAVAMRGVSGPLAELLRQPFTPPPNSPLARLLAGEPVVQFADLFELAQQRPDDRRAQAGAQYGLRTVLFVPLRKDDALLGYITAYRQEVRPFSEREIALLQNFAAQAVIAMENTRLITEISEALEQQTATAEVLQVINASPGDLAPVFEAMLEKAIRLCEAEFGTLRTWDGERFHLGAAHGDPELIEWTKRQRPFTPINGNFPLGRIVRGAEIVRITDALLASYQTDSGFRAMAAAIGFRSGIAVALRKDATLLGAISVYRKNEVRPFTDKQIALLQSFAAQAVIAMENARLLDEIRQRQEELRVTFENMGDGVAMFDETQYLAAWNRKFQDILDLPDALLGQRRTYEEHLRFLAARGDFGPGVDTVEQIEELVASTGQPYGYERTRPDGRVIEIRRNPVPDGGFVLIYSDITERKRSEEEIRAARDAAETALRELRTAQANLIQAEKMASLGQLTAGIAHEIKNPLNFVNNFAALSVDLLSELKDAIAPAEPALTEKQRAEVEDVSAMLTSNLEKITEHGKRADGIVKAMLEHSRGSSGERRMVDLNALIDEALNLAYHGARAQDQSFNITLERDFGEGIAPIEVNPQDITRVFLNLFANGFYATTKRARDGGDAGFVPTLKVTTIDAGEAVEIRVRDNGTGIPADIRDKLFQPFFTTKPTGEGTGLGLSITYDIVTQQHGGNIAVDSKLGEYSEFTIRLPRIP